MKTILDNTTELSWIQVQFLKEAVEILLSARKTLQYTYAFAYYLLKDENSTIIFEQNQRDLEMVVEQLSELLEKPFIVDGGETGDGKGKMNILEMKQDIMNKSAYVISRREILLKDCCDGNYISNSKKLMKVSV
jgi:ariadne-1